MSDSASVMIDPAKVIHDAALVMTDAAMISYGPATITGDAVLVITGFPAVTNRSKENDNGCRAVTVEPKSTMATSIGFAAFGSSRS